MPQRTIGARAAAANTPLKTFAEEPELLIKNGRYGPYIAYKGKNYRIPKGTKPEAVSYTHLGPQTRNVGIADGGAG